MRNAEAALASLGQADPGGLARVYLIHGEESYYQTRLLQAIRRLSLDPALEAFNYTYLEHEGATAGAVRAALLTPPVMAPCRLVVARDPAELTAGRPGKARAGEGSGEGAGEGTGEGSDEDAGDGSAEGTGESSGRGAGEVTAEGSGGQGPEGEVGTFKGEVPAGLPPAPSPGEIAKRWSALLEEVPAEARLVLTISQELPASSPLLRTAVKLEPVVEVIRCLEATPKSAEAWVRKIAVELGGDIDPEASQALVLRSGSSLAILEREIEKLLTYVASPERCVESPGDPKAGGRPRITVRDVLEAATPSAEASVFDMVDHIGNRRSYQAVTTLRRLIEQGEAPLGLMAMVTRQVRLVFIAREMLAEGATVRDVEERLKLPTWVVRNYLAQARNFNRDQLVRMMRNLARLDLEIKTGRQEPGAALEMFILQAAS